MEYIFCEMKKKNVTLMLLWEEYKRDHPDGIMYTQFCDRYRNFKANNKISMHKEHKAGEEVEVDWAGDTMSYVDTSTGEVKPAYVFVAVLPASSYPFAYAYEDMKTPNWIDAHELLLELEDAKNENRYSKFMTGLQNIKLLILDDIGLKSYTLEESRDILEIAESRYNRALTILSGQISHTKWYDLFPDPTIADAIMDRIIHNSYILTLDSKKSMREVMAEKTIKSIEKD